MKSFEEMTTKDWCSLYAIMNMLLKEKVIVFDLNKSYVEFHADEAMSYLENQNVALQHEIEKKDKIIDEAREFLKEFHNYENRFKWCEEDYVKTILELEKILERSKNDN